MDGRTYRPCVVAAFVNSDHLLLVGRRSDHHKSWQLPQGGVDPGESHEQALRREVYEEVGISNLTIISNLDSVVKYEFPDDANFALSRTYRGQEQMWYHCELVDGHPPDLDLAIDKEFSCLDWMAPTTLLKEVIWWKRSVYQQALTQLKII